MIGSQIFRRHVVVYISGVEWISALDNENPQEEAKTRNII